VGSLLVRFIAFEAEVLLPPILFGLGSASPLRLPTYFQDGSALNGLQYCLPSLGNIVGDGVEAGVRKDVGRLGIYPSPPDPLWPHSRESPRGFHVESLQTLQYRGWQHPSVATVIQQDCVNHGLVKHDGNGRQNLFLGKYLL
jgi:hypothetical protein